MKLKWISHDTSLAAGTRWKCDVREFCIPVVELELNEGVTVVIYQHIKSMLIAGARILDQEDVGLRWLPLEQLHSESESWRLKSVFDGVPTVAFNTPDNHRCIVYQETEVKKVLCVRIQRR